jgi:hypothetical protein
MTRQPDYAEARQYAIRSIRDFLEGTGKKWDWDDFTSLSLAFPDLEVVRSFCTELPRTHPHPVWYCNEDGLILSRKRLEELEGYESPTPAMRERDQRSTL